MRFEVVSKYKDSNISIPQPATSGSAGCDLRAAEDIVIPSFFREQYGKYPKGENLSYTIEENERNIAAIGGRMTLVPTGLKAYLDKGTCLLILPRSSMPLKQWLFVANTPGLIDIDYVDNESNEGEIFVQLMNLTPNPIQIKKGDKIGQALIVPYLMPENATPEKQERTGGFGSTGI